MKPLRCTDGPLGRLDGTMLFDETNLSEAAIHQTDFVGSTYLLSQIMF